MPTVAFTTLGCRLNQAESDVMTEELLGHGMTPADPGESPDVVVINTCTVTKEATKASRMAIRRAVRAHPDAKIVVAGCYAVSDRDEIEAIDGVDVIVGNDEKERFVSALAGAAPTMPLLQVSMPRKPAVTPARVRANLKVQTGCDEWCTFCIIPTTRGPLRSLDEESILAEARARVEAGARELILTGVHLGKYTYDSGGDESSLVRLFERLLDIEGLWRLRLSSILSRHLTDEVLGFMANEPRMCRYLHVPLQSGDPAVLEAMHRPYDIDTYLDAIDRTKRALPDVALATDVIVGFPGETEEAFSNTLRVVERVGFSKLHVFRYSPRDGTAAAARRDDVNGNVKRDRSKRLIDLGNEIRQRFLAAHLQAPVEVLVEDERVIDGVSVCSGQTDDYVRAWFEGSGHLGELVAVQANEVRADGLRGGHVIETLRRRDG
ncbi:MAG TPA: tRNA (N(6)-L-threonylcarbamoyladenosine(37)-C(2))-methylthiotransferase MtaB [Actinomycetota bacterium]|nr:tRNA (N(6)-L-threonylcarbamoyladenosine(37)-C(2))-methylthiotransferase MtaB [Actinomycetota bacterium]